MDFKLDIDADEVNRHVSQAILDSCIGKELKDGIEKEVKELVSGSWNKPGLLDGIIRAEVKNILRDLLRGEEYGPKLDREVRVAITDETIKAVVNKTMLDLIDLDIKD